MWSSVTRPPTPRRKSKRTWHRFWAEATDEKFHYSEPERMTRICPRRHSSNSTYTPLAHSFRIQPTHRRSTAMAKRIKADQEALMSDLQDALSDTEAMLSDLASEGGQMAKDL